MKLPGFSYIHVVDKAFAVKRISEIITASFSGDSTLDALLTHCIDVADKIIKGQANKHLKNLTVEIEEMDLLRDNIYRSMLYRLKAVKFNPKYTEQSEAANRLLVNVFGETLALIYMPLGTESAGIEEKLQILTEKHVADVELTGIGELTKDLKTANDEFNILYSARTEKLGEIPESYTAFNTEINENLRVLCGYIKLKMDKNDAETLFDPLNRAKKRTTPSKPEVEVEV
jgi:Family of unknown function (DUF6261)